MAGKETITYTPATSTHYGDMDEFAQHKPDRAMIIGSGIAGMAAALCLSKAGIEAVIYESRTSSRDSSGSFFGIHPNGRDVLETLDIADSVLAGGIATREFHFSNHKRSLATIPTDIVTIERGAVARGLLAEAVNRDIDIQYNKKLTTVDQNENQVMASFEDGSRAYGAYLIGADGIHSKARRAVFGESPRPYYSGMVRSSAITENVLGIKPTYGTTNMIMGRNAFFSYLVRQDGYINWFSNRFDIQEPLRGEIEAIQQADWKADLLHLYEDDNPIIKAIIAATDVQIQKYPVYDMPLIDNWHKERICLIGDAAHTPSSKAGQGASMALEDAIIIAKCLRDMPDPPQAFATFESLRKPRVEALLRKTRKSTDSRTPRTVVGRFIADLFLPIDLKIANQTTRRMYNYHVNWDELVKTNKH